MRKLSLILVLLALVFLSTAGDVGAYNVYYGSLHNHSKDSDGTGNASSHYEYARDTAGLDFFSLADHCSYPYGKNDGLTVSEYNAQKDVADSFNNDGTFVAFWGFEWTSDDTSWGGPSTLLGKGHLYIINSPDRCEADEEATNDLNELVDWMSTRNCVAFFNHPGEYGYSNYFDNFNFNYTDKIVGMELWNRSNEYYTRTNPDDPQGRRWYDNALDEGWYIGATGAHDSHGSTPGAGQRRLAILADNLTRSDLYSAMQARRFYSTQDNNLILSFTCNGNQMGSQIDGGSLNVAIDASDGDSEIFSKIDLLKNGTIIETWTPGVTNPSVSTTVGSTTGDYFYVVLYQGGGWQAISSPIFITGSGDPDVTPPSPDPMTWAAVPYATSESSISMTATTATDSENGVEYYFTCTAGGGNDSGWQTGTNYEDTGLAPETQYTYTVTARDTSGNYNETAPSTAESATTDDDIYPPSPDPMTWDVVPAPGGGSNILVYEPFDYTAGPLNGVTTNAVGLTGNWTAGSITGIEAGSATYGSLPVTGNRMDLSATNNSAQAYCYAALDTSVLTGYLDDGDELWFSAVARTSGTVTGNSLRFQIGLGASNNVGFLMDQSTVSTSRVRALETDGGSETLSSGSGTFAGGNQLVVGKITFGATDTVEVYMPGTDLVLPGSPVGTVQTTLDQTATDWIQINMNNGNSMICGDEIRIGESYEAVTGQSTPGSGSDSISMKATTATDPSGVEYYFTCTAGGGNDSLWQDSESYTDTGLTPETQYTYTVTARDKSTAQNTTAASTAESATTEPSGGDTTPPDPDPMTWATVPYATGQTSIAMVATTATDTNGVEYYFTCTAGGGNDSGWQDQTSYEDTGLQPSTQYTYTVTARDKSTNQNTTAASTAESATTDGDCTPTDMHIEAVVCSEAACGGPNRNGVATVTIYDDCGDPVSGALVDVTFTGDFSETIYDVATNGSGVAVITTTGCVKKPAFTATVIDVTDTLPYDSNDDVTDNCSG